MKLLDLLQQVPDYTHDAVIITEGVVGDDGPRILYVNGAFTRLTGYGADEIIGNTPRMFHGSNTDPETVDRIRKSLVEKKAISTELINYAKDGREYWVEISITPVLDKTGECAYFIAIEKDVTERRVMEEATSKQGIAFLNNELRTRAILYSIGDAIVTFTPEGCIESFSPVAERVFGHDVLEVDDIGIVDLFPASLRGEVENWYNGILETGGDARREIKAQRKDGSRFTAEIHLSSIDQGGKPLLVMAVRDISDLKEAQAKARRHAERVALLRESASIANNARSKEEAISGVLNLIAEHYWLSAGHCWRVDRHEEKLYSYGVWVGEEMEPLRSVTLETVFANGCGSAGKAYAFSRPLVITDIAEAEGVIRRDAALEAGVVSAFHLPVYSGDDLVAMMEFFNALAWSPDEEDLEILHNIGCQLGRAIEREHAREELIAAKESAESATRAKSEFLANMSHELRTPMNGILGLANLLKDSTLSGDQQDCVDALTLSASSLLTILNDILDFSKIEAGELVLENEAYRLEEDCISRVRDLMLPLAASKQISLDTHVAPDVPPACMGDANRVQQILVNLVGNAIKFTSEGGVSLHVFRQEQADGEVLRFEVRDTGIGIPAQHHEYIFNKFTQGDSTTTRKYGGTGLGLAICRQLVEMMGGRIGVESTPGSGSVFWFAVPVVEAAMPADKPVENALVSLPVENAKVLMVEDHPINQMLLSKLLTKLGIRHIDKAENGYEAIAALDRSDYTLILMDCQMPELDGYETTRFLRAREEADHGIHIPIIAMTANAMVGDREKCLKTGMDDYLSKPIDLPSLSQTLGRWLKVQNRLPTTAPSLEAQARCDHPIDMDHLQNFTDGNREEERMLFCIFLSRAVEVQEMLANALAGNDNEAWRKAAHNLKGASGNLGAKRLFELCHEAEVGHQSSGADKQEMLSGIDEELERVRYFIEYTKGHPPMDGPMDEPIALHA